jgi:hypothetical protein
MTCCGTDCRAKARAYGCASNSSRGSTSVGHLLGGMSDLLQRPLSADGVIGLEFIKWFSGRRHYTWTREDGCASA